MKIFVTHYTKLCDRKADILLEFKKHNITDYEFIEKYDQEDLTDAEIGMFDTNIRKSVMSLTLKHICAYRQIKDLYDYALILEDDVILSDNFVSILNQYMSELPSDYDMMFIGDGCKLHIHPMLLQKDKHVYPKDIYPTNWGGDGGSRCTDSYIVSKKCAIKLCEYVDTLESKISLTTDWWLNAVMRACNFSIYWAEPTIVTQGSEIAKYTSSTSI